MAYGYIYLITDKTNGKVYVGQTARDIWTRFDEHCRSKIMTPLHTAIQEKGHQNFILTELEKIEIEKLDEREQYWIKEYDSYNSGYNATYGGRGTVTNYAQIRVVENNFIIDSAAELARLMEKNVGWKAEFMASCLKRAQTTGEEFLGYHFEEIISSSRTSEDEVENWIKTLQIRHTGKKIHCFELNKDFDTIADCARYLIDNDLYAGTSKTPMQSLVTSLGKQLHGVNNSIETKQGYMTFGFLPGTTKQKGQTENPFQKTKVYCPQIDKEFESQIAAANYFTENKVWGNIKLKTAKLRISNVVNGNFPDYKGYTFEKIDD